MSDERLTKILDAVEEWMRLQPSGVSMREWVTAHCEPIVQYGIMHPSDRALGLDHFDEEVWGADDRPVLFDTAEEAQGRITERAREYPRSEWRKARVVTFIPGWPKVYPRWSELPAEKASA